MPNSHHDELMFLVSYLLEERNDATQKAELEKWTPLRPSTANACGTYSAVW